MVLVIALASILDAGEPARIRFGVSSVGIGGRPAVGGIVTGLVHARGALEAEFAADGIAVEWTFNKGAGPQTNEQLAGGLIDVAWQGDFPALIGRAQGLSTRLLLADGRGGFVHLAVHPDAPARSLRDLVGKRMVIFKGTATQLLVARILGQHGLTERDFKIITLDAQSSLPALYSRDVDAVWGGASFLDLEAQGSVRLVLSTRDPPPAPHRERIRAYTAILAASDFVDRHPAIVQRIVSVFVRTAAWSADPANTETVIDLWSRSGTSPEVYRRDLAALPLRERLSPLLDTQCLDHLRTVAQTAFDLRLIRRQVSIDDWPAPHFLAEALRAQNLEQFWK